MVQRRRRERSRFKTKKEAIEKFGGENITWYDSTYPDRGYRYSNNCFYCGAPGMGYIVEELSDGTLIGKPICRFHFGAE